MQELLLYINQAQENIFKYNTNDVHQSTGYICNKLDKLIINFSEEGREELNEILYYINISLTNKDYLLYADILEYELKPFVQENEEKGGNK